MKLPIDLKIDPTLDLVLQREIDVPRELVWQAWTDPKHYPHWFCPRPWAVSRAEIDLRPGGRFSNVMRSPEGVEMPENVGCILEVVPNERLVWTDSVQPDYRPSDKGFMTAYILLEAIPAGTRYTAIVLHKDEASVKQHAEMGFHDGWGKALDQLVEYVKTW